MFDGNHTNPINGSESAKPKDNESTALKKENPALESHTISHIELANIIHGPPGTKRVIHTRQNETTNDQTPKNDSGLAFDNPRDRPSRNPLGPNVQMSGSAGRHKGGRIEKTVIQDFASTMKNGHMDRHSPHLWQKNLFAQSFVSDDNLRRELDLKIHSGHDDSQALEAIRNNPHDQEVLNKRAQWAVERVASEYIPEVTKKDLGWGTQLLYAFMLYNIEGAESVKVFLERAIRQKHAVDVVTGVGAYYRRHPGLLLGDISQRMHLDSMTSDAYALGKR
ncbi:hypothetical protein BDP55DRAFT_729517 [Colletotrichum godetiae]|uniref:Uncharacterized protein n=1 Tax=Colletotrichum godetiae TaxID=1209918 RepID=A0AAJ0AJN2_9PEZI|nr:uncharacterized protein BDP55DRAFT_729517 [Colletotrichum godetiae]KAK1674489.1 hypothetical protein BDP55DRAFT_729517 [Colletotrichum godetiae]